MFHLFQIMILIYPAVAGLYFRYFALFTPMQILPLNNAGGIHYPPTCPCIHLSILSIQINHADLSLVAGFIFDIRPFSPSRRYSSHSGESIILFGHVLVSTRSIISVKSTILPILLLQVYFRYFALFTLQKWFPTAREGSISLLNIIFRCHFVYLFIQIMIYPCFLHQLFVLSHRCIFCTQCEGLQWCDGCDAGGSWCHGRTRFDRVWGWTSVIYHTNDSACSGPCYLRHYSTASAGSAKCTSLQLLGGL